MQSLSLEQIKSVAHGVARIEESDGLVQLHRFTKEQQELYKSTSEDFYMKTFATAGITLEFETESKNLFLSVSISKGSSRSFFTHSIFVNDEKIGELTGDIGDKENVTFEKNFFLPSGLKKVKILFPWSVCSRINSIQLDDNASVIPVQKKCKLLILGDSITQGYDALKPENAYAIQLASSLDASAINKGIAGEQFFPSLTKQSEDFKPDYITVAYGTNDWRHSNKESFQRRCTEFFENLRESYPDVKIIALTPIWRVDINKPQEFGEPLRFISSHIKKVAKTISKMTVIECINMIPHDSQYFQTDGVHPIDIGFMHYGENIIKEVKSII